MAGGGERENNMSPRSPVGDFPREEDGSSGGERICFVAENVSVLLPPYRSPLSNFHSVERHPEGPGQYKHVTSNKNLFPASLVLSAFHAILMLKSSSFCACLISALLFALGISS